MIAKRRSRAITRAGYIRLLARVVCIALFCWVLFTFGFLVTQCKGQAMFPSLKDGDLCVVFRREAQTLFHDKLKAKDIVAYRVEDNRLFGRVVAVAGDTVSISEAGSVSVNGSADSGEILFPTYPMGELEYPFTVPEGCVFVLGDHRTDTVDSRTVGPIPLESVEGKVISILRRRGL